MILDGPNHILQTTYLELPDELVAIVLDEISGKIAACSSSLVHVYKPYGRDEGALRVRVVNRVPGLDHYSLSMLVVPPMPPPCNEQRDDPYTFMGPG